MSCKVLYRVVFKIVLGEVKPRKALRKEISIKAIYTYLKGSVLVLRCKYVQKFNMCLFDCFSIYRVFDGQRN